MTTNRTITEKYRISSDVQYNVVMRMLERSSRSAELCDLEISRALDNLIDAVSFHATAINDMQHQMAQFSQAQRPNKTEESNVS